MNRALHTLAQDKPHEQLQPAVHIQLPAAAYDSSLPARLVHIIFMPAAAVAAAAHSLWSACKLSMPTILPPRLPLPPPPPFPPPPPRLLLPPLPPLLLRTLLMAVGSKMV
jgi:hypothetical protein